MTDSTKSQLKETDLELKADFPEELSHDEFQAWRNDASHLQTDSESPLIAKGRENIKNASTEPSKLLSDLAPNIQLFDEIESENTNYPENPECSVRIQELEADLEKQILENSDDRKVMVLQTKQIQELEKQIENLEVKNAFPAKTLCPACAEEAIRLDVVDLQHQITALEENLKEACIARDQWKQTADKNKQLEGLVTSFGDNQDTILAENDELKLQRDTLNDENNELRCRVAELEAEIESWHDGV